MSDQEPKPWSRRQCAEQILLHYLQIRGFCWPGADGLTASDVLFSYPAAVAAGRVPGKQELLQRHPEFAAELEQLFVE